MLSGADTIASISTPIGEGGIGIIRISGPSSIKVAGRVFKKKDGKPPSFKSFKIYYGFIHESKSGRRIDEVIVAVMKAPRSYTREDVVEIQSHGGVIALNKILGEVLKSGARLAEPGEFTKRAFLNGRLDLAEAEAVIDIIRAKTESSMKVAFSQLSGGLSSIIEGIRDRIIRWLAHLEAEIDFPEDEVPHFSREALSENLKSLKKEIKELLSSADSGRIFREGVHTAIIGRPNVGKSSILNALLGEARAIVTDVPGTTRDTIEEWYNLKGVPLKVIDTAGLRESTDPVEIKGVERTREALSGADIVLFVIDASSRLTGEDIKIFKDVEGKKCIFILNKKDLPSLIEIEKLMELVPEGKWVETSATTSKGIKELQNAILEVIFHGRVHSPEGCFVSSLRHKKSLEKTLMYIEEVEKSLKKSLPSDFLTIDLKGALESLGEITGSNITEDIIDRIFSGFCIGK
ncbi:MAG: tRNA uridine-5-carboxymethylaminomethyl(34) synthesis GTPase MnmE [Firmicutes bacterium]|nr:tRNA uridine-5-carboxymethylaminomethyl(34) synthesis GTPase MnmE [Bacillota bacterium]